MSIFQDIISIVPTDIMTPFQAGNSPQLIVMALVLGNALLVAGHQAENLIRIVDEAYHVILMRFSFGFDSMHPMHLRIGGFLFVIFFVEFFVVFFVSEVLCVTLDVDLPSAELCCQSYVLAFLTDGQ